MDGWHLTVFLVAFKPLPRPKYGVVVEYIGCKKEKESEMDTYSSFLSLAFATNEFSAM